MTVDIVNKITKTYDHNNKLVKMIDENLTKLGNVFESHFHYYFFITIISEIISKTNESTVNHKVRLTFNGWVLLILILFSLSLFFII
jgi:hypothetical protein